MPTTPETNHPLPTIALCVIAKNEADMIGECLDSVRDFVDEIVVVDTGSTDRTVDIAREHGARVEHFDWINDFAAARNYAIESATTDWVLMLDADERLDPEGGPLLRQAAARLPRGYYGICLQIENRVRDRSMAHYMTRFFPRHPDLRFEGSIHEELKSRSKELGELVMLLPMARIIHYGYDPELYAKRRKDERNMRMLQQELEKDPDNARLHYYMMQQHCSQRRHEEALPYAPRFMANKHQMRQAFELEVNRMWLECLWVLERWDEAEQVFQTAAASNGLSSYGYEMVANFELSRKRVAAALENFTRARDSNLPMGLWGRPTGDDWELATKVADCHWELGHYKRALSELEHALPLIPEDKRRQVVVVAVRRCLDSHLYAAAYRWSNRAHEYSENLKADLEVVELVQSIPARFVTSGPYAAIDRAVASENWQAAYDAALELPLDASAALARVLHLSARFSNDGAPDAALDVLERAMDAHPKEALIYWRLAQALNVLRRHADAANALAAFEGLDGAGQLALAA